MTLNGNGIKEAAKAVTSIATSLPPSFIALLVINTIFIGGLFWFESHQTTARAQVLEHLIESCEQDLARGMK